MIRLLFLIVPAALAVMRLRLKKYPYSAAVTLSCAAIVALTGLDDGGTLMAIGLIVSAVGDWMLAHQVGHPDRFIKGVGLFAAGHLWFIAYAARTAAFALWPVIAINALTAGYALYLTRRVLPGQTGLISAALPLYALISLCGLLFALLRAAPVADKALYALGIASIIFSDTMIAENEFAKNKRAARWVLPTYYLCHILLAASRLV